MGQWDGHPLLWSNSSETCPWGELWGLLQGKSRPTVLMRVCVLSRFSRVQLFLTPWVAHQAPLSMGFSRQEYWSEVPFPSPGHLPDPGIKLGSPALQMDSLLSEPPGKPRCYATRSHSLKKPPLHHMLYFPFFLSYLPSEWGSRTDLLELKWQRDNSPCRAERTCQTKQWPS